VNVHRYTITVKGTPEKRIRKLEALAAEAGAAGDFVRSTYRAWLCRDLLLAGFTEQEVMDATGLSIHTVAQARRRLPGEISLEGRDYVAR
jgi:hypothetical protein